MNKNDRKLLRLNRTTIRSLTGAQLARAIGAKGTGWGGPTTSQKMEGECASKSCIIVQGCGYTQDVGCEVYSANNCP